MENMDLTELYHNQREITKQKYDDLQQLLDYVPDVYHDFFKNLNFGEDSFDYSLAIRHSDDEEEEE